MVADRPENAEKLRLKFSGEVAGLLPRPMLTVSLVALMKLPCPSKLIRPVPTAMPTPEPGWLSERIGIPAVSGFAAVLRLHLGGDGDVHWVAQRVIGHEVRYGTGTDRLLRCVERQAHRGGDLAGVGELEGRGIDGNRVIVAIVADNRDLAVAIDDRAGSGARRIVGDWVGCRGAVVGLNPGGLVDEVQQIEHGRRRSDFIDLLVSVSCPLVPVSVKVPSWNRFWVPVPLLATTLVSSVLLVVRASHIERLAGGGHARRGAVERGIAHIVGEARVRRGIGRAVRQLAYEVKISAIRCRVPVNTNRLPLSAVGHWQIVQLNPTIDHVDRPDQRRRAGFRRLPPGCRWSRRCSRHIGKGDVIAVIARQRSPRSASGGRLGRCQGPRSHRWWYRCRNQPDLESWSAA